MVSTQALAQGKHSRRPGLDRLTSAGGSHVARELMRMPINWNTAVIHILLCCITKQMEALGPFHAANLLDIERFQTIFKGLARGTADVMESILNHYVLLESSLSNRLTCDMDWANPALPSSFAGHVARFDSSDRADSFCRGLGASTPYVLKSHEYKQVQTMWADEYPDCHSLHRKFNAARRSSGRARQCPSISLWRSGSITSEERKWQQMKPQVQVENPLYTMHGMIVAILYYVWSCSLLLHVASIIMYGILYYV